MKFRSSNAKSAGAYVSALSKRTLRFFFLNYQPFKELNTRCHRTTAEGLVPGEMKTARTPREVPVFSIIKISPWSSAPSHPTRLHRLKFHILY